MPRLYTITASAAPIIFWQLIAAHLGRDLLESEIFGHKAGAVKDKSGLIEEANKGTLFLDEIGEMHIDLQSKLLMVLETGEFINVGDTKPVEVNVRIISATNQDLVYEIKSGRFREDLYYRLTVFTIQLPSLKERKEDILPLATFYAYIFAAKTNRLVKSMTLEFIAALHTHCWKGIIRELKNVIERVVIFEGENALTVDHNKELYMQ